jgi:hypothetical protein
MRDRRKAMTPSEVVMSAGDADLSLGVLAAISSARRSETRVATARRRATGHDRADDREQKQDGK